MFFMLPITLYLHGGVRRARGKCVSDRGSKTSVCNSRIRALMLLFSANFASAAHTQITANQCLGSSNNNIQFQLMRFVPRDCSACVSVGVTDIDCYRSLINGPCVSPVDNRFSLNFAQPASRAAAVAAEGYSVTHFMFQLTMSRHQRPRTHGTHARLSSTQLSRVA